MCRHCEVGVHIYENKVSLQKGYQVINDATLTSVVHIDLRNIAVMQIDINYCPICGCNLKESDTQVI